MKFEIGQFVNVEEDPENPWVVLELVNEHDEIYRLGRAGTLGIQREVPHYLMTLDED